MSRRAHCLPLLIITALLSGCSHEYEEFSASDFRVAIVEATKKCSETVFDRTVPQADCYSAAELPQIKKYLPFSIASYNSFSERRLEAARKFDASTASEYAQYVDYRKKLRIAETVAVAKEPRFGQKSSQLVKDINAAEVKKVCTLSTELASAGCARAIVIPIWDRDAPETRSVIDEYYDTYDRIGNLYDKSGAPEEIQKARAVYAAEVDALVKLFYANVRESIQQHQLAQQEEERKAAQDRKDLNDFLDGLSVVMAGAANAAANARNSAPPANTPLHCTSSTLYATTYTNCY